MLFQVPSRLIAVLPPTFAIKVEVEGEEAGEGLLWPDAGAISSGTISSGATSEKPSTNNAPTMFRFIVFSWEIVARAVALRSGHNENRVLRRHDQAGAAL